ncbi:glycosyltransferase family 10 [Puniceicoccaceae bacterium]|nr:glycosyltransferase family 10 [Puniceicoccaceae bacterium]
MHSVKIYLPWRNKLPPTLFRQTLKNCGIWKNYKFSINEEKEPCDFLVVFAGQNSIIEEHIHKKNTLFIAGEPPAIKGYSEAYLAQFGSVICSDPKLHHPQKRLYQQGYPWFCGIRFDESGEQHITKSYDDFRQDTNIKKTKLLSVVCSDKQSKPGHNKRFQFVQKLKEAFGDELDLYGTGQNPIADKSEAIRPYKYHIAIENSEAPHYWSEKLSDCYLEGAFPLYSGCPNLQDYFPKNAYASIDLNDLEGTVQQIKCAIEEDRYTQSLQAIKEAKTRVLNDYNLFNLITEHFDRLNLIDNKSEKPFVAYPSKWLRKGPLYRLKFKIKQMIK